MAIVFADRVKVRAYTPGTGDFTLGSVTPGFQSFEAVGNGNQCYYGIEDHAGNWEVGLGTYTSAGPTLTRDTIISSSNSNLIVNFPNGGKSVFTTFPSTLAATVLASIPSQLANNGNSLSLLADGTVLFPGEASQPYQMPASQYGYYTATTPVVIFTSASEWTEVMKATIHVKTNTDVGGVFTNYHQICEMLIAKKEVYDSNIPSTIITVEAMVYGVTHTSALPLATFDVQWNNTTNRIEITMVRDPAYSYVNAKVMATESVNLD